MTEWQWQCRTSSGISSRSMFTCTDETTSFSSSGRVSNQIKASPRTHSVFSASCNRAEVSKTNASVEFTGEDDVLIALATNARAKVKHARQVFATAGWKKRHDGQGVHLFERKSIPGVFDVAASTALPCTATEILQVLSSRNSDDFNATVVALAGDNFSYAVTLREIPTSSLNTHLTTKRIEFTGSFPFVSKTKTIEFLDYVDYNYETRTAIRTFHTLRRDRGGRLVVSGDVLAGYVLVERAQSHLTSVFYFGTYTMSPDEVKAISIVRGKLKIATVRDASAQALVKFAKLIPKISDIAIRRRLGAVGSVDLADNLGDGTCSGCGKLVKDSLLRKKHMCYICGHHTCTSCSKSQSVEGLIGVVERLRVCCMCISATRHRAFDTVGQLKDGFFPLDKTRGFSSTGSMSGTFLTSPSSVQTADARDQKLV